MTQDDFLYFRKPANIPTTFWNQKSYLQLLEENWHLQNQKKYFSASQEYGLVNRLDNETSGLIFFAKNKKIYQEYKVLQKNWLVEKTYLADIKWKYFWPQIIKYKIIHHPDKKEKMLVKKNALAEQIYFTHVEILFYDEIKNITTLEIKIKKWIRHQIRVHLTSIWHPIIWDKIYWSWEWNLKLFSIGLKILD